MATDRETQREIATEGGKPDTAGADRAGGIDAQIAAIEAAHPNRLDANFRPDTQITVDMSLAVKEAERLVAERDKIKSKVPRHPAINARLSGIMRGEEPTKIVISTPELDAKIEAAQTEIARLKGISNALKRGETGPADKYLKGNEERHRAELAAAQEEIGRLREKIASGEADLAEMGAKLKEAAQQESHAAGKLRRVIDQRQYLKLTTRRQDGPEQLAA